MEARMQSELEQPIVVRSSRDTDVEAMLAIYRRHIRHGIEEGVSDLKHRSPMICATGARTCATADSSHLVATRAEISWVTPMWCCSVSGQPIAIR